MIDVLEDNKSALDAKRKAETDEVRQQELEQELEKLKKAMARATITFGLITEPASTKEKQDLLKETTEDFQNGGATGASDQVRGLVQTAVKEVPTGDAPSDAPSEGELDKLKGNLIEISGDELKKAADLADAETSQSDEAADEALRKTQGVLEGAVEAKKAAQQAAEDAKEEAAKIATATPNGESDTGTENPDAGGSPTELAEKAEAVKQQTKDASDRTAKAVDLVVEGVVKQSREQLRDKAELRERVFEGLDIHRLVVAYDGQKDADKKRAVTIEEAVKAFMVEGIAKEGQGEVVSVLEDIPANEKKLEIDILQPDHDELRYQDGDLESETIATKIADFLVNEHNFRFKLVALPASVIAKREYEFWFGTSEAPLADAEAYVPAAAGMAPAAESGTGTSPP